MTTPRGLFSLRGKSLVVVALLVVIALGLITTAANADGIILTLNDKDFGHPSTTGLLTSVTLSSTGFLIQEGDSFTISCSPPSSIKCNVKTFDFNVVNSPSYNVVTTFDTQWVDPPEVVIEWAYSPDDAHWSSQNQPKVTFHYIHDGTPYTAESPLLKIASCWGNDGKDQCLNGGSCPDSGTVDGCQCATGFSGDHCQYSWACEYLGSTQPGTCSYDTATKWAEANPQQVQCGNLTWIKPFVCLDSTTQAAAVAGPESCTAPKPTFNTSPVDFVCESKCSNLYEPLCEVTVNQSPLNLNSAFPCDLSFCGVPVDCGQHFSVNLAAKTSGTAFFYNSKENIIEQIQYNPTDKIITMTEPFLFTGNARFALTPTGGTATPLATIPQAVQCDAQLYCDNNGTWVLCGDAYDVANKPGWTLSTAPICQTTTQTVTASPNTPNCRVVLPDGTNVSANGCWKQVDVETIEIDPCQADPCTVCAQTPTCSSTGTSSREGAAPLTFEYGTCLENCECTFGTTAEASCGESFTFNWSYPITGASDGHITLKNSQGGLVGVVAIGNLEDKTVAAKWLFPSTQNEKITAAALFSGPYDPDASSLPISTTDITVTADEFCTAEITCPDGKLCVPPTLADFKQNYSGPKSTTFTYSPENLTCSQTETPVTATAVGTSCGVFSKGVYQGPFDAAHVTSPCSPSFTQTYNLQPCQKTCSECGAASCSATFANDNAKMPLTCTDTTGCDCSVQVSNLDNFHCSDEITFTFSFPQELAVTTAMITIESNGVTFADIPNVDTTQPYRLFWTFPGASFTATVTAPTSTVQPAVASTPITFPASSEPCGWVWYGAQNVPQNLSPTVPTPGWKVNVPDNTRCSQDVQLIRDLDDADNWRCGFMFQGQLRVWDETHDFGLPSSPCSTVNPVLISPTGCNPGTCTECDVADACTAVWAGEPVTFPPAACNTFCACTPTNLAFKNPEQVVTCHDTVEITWFYSDTLPAEDGLIEILNTTPAITFTVPLADQAASFKVDFISRGDLVFRFKDLSGNDPIPLSYPQTGHCAYYLQCFDAASDSPAFGADHIKACEAPSPQQVLQNQLGLWSTLSPVDQNTFACDTKVALTAPQHQYCSLGTSTGTVFTAVANLSSCPQAADTVDTDYSVACQPQCSPTTCGLSCVADFEFFPLPTFTNCGDVGADRGCGCEAKIQSISEGMDCQDEVTVTWTIDLSGRDPSDNLIISSTRPGPNGGEPIVVQKQSIPVQLKNGQVKFHYEGVAPSGSVLTFSFEKATTTGITTATAGEPCIPTWKCLDANGKLLANCDLLEKELCDTCTATPIPATRYACATGPNLTPDECTDPKPEKDLTCKCALTCTVGSDDFGCDTEESWTLSTTCGVLDSRQNPHLVTGSKKTIPCTPEQVADKDSECFIAKTQRLTGKNVELCQVEPECRTNAVQDWGVCDADFETCTPTVPATCAPRSRLVSCAVVHGDKTSNSAEISVKEIAAIFGLEETDSDLTQTDVTAAITALEASCSTALSDNPLDNNCKCDPTVFCWKNSATTTLPTLSDLTNLEPCGTAQANFPCPDRCADAGLDTVTATRSVFCFNDVGVFAARAEDDSCSPLPLTPTDFQCEALVQCEAQFFCKKLADSVTTVATAQDLIAVDSTDSLPCSQVPIVSHCFASRSDAGDTTPEFPLTADTCTARNSEFEHFYARQVGCSVRDKVTQKPLAPNPAYSVFCDVPDRPAATQDGCVDWNGCDPADVQEIEVTFDTETVTNNQILDVDLNFPLSTSATVSFNMDFLGPLGKSQIVLEYSPKVGSATSQTSRVWFSISSTLATTSTPSIDWVIDPANPPALFKTVGADGQVVFQDSQLVFVRVFVSGSNTPLKHYPVTVKFIRNKTCAANPGIFTGLNVDCEDKNDVATLVCANGITPDLESPYGPCSRSSTCNALTPTCQNSGFYLVSDSASGCADSCSCPGGQTYVDQCKTCAQCPIGLGVPRAAQDTECGCASCRTGFKNGSGIGDLSCGDCDVKINVRVNNAAQNLLDTIAVGAQNNPDLDFFISNTRQFVSRQLNYPVAQITIPTGTLVATGTQNKDVSMEVVLTGSCRDLIVQQDFSTLVSSSNTSPNLAGPVNAYDKAAFDSALAGDAAFKAFAVGDNTVVTSQSAFDAPPVFVPVIDGKKKSTNIVAIVVPVVVGVIAVCVIIIVVYLLCCRNGGSTDSGSPSPSETKSKPAKPSKPSKAARQTADDAHLELV